MILDILDKIIRFFGSIYPYAKSINDVIGKVLPAMSYYLTVYFIIGLFFTRKFKPAKNNHKYGICIAARNEEKVIGNLLDSIHKQDYPSELLTVFVVADNCTDKTAEIARSKGAIVYERFDDKHKTKGYALEFLFDRIEEDYKRELIHQNSPLPAITRQNYYAVHLFENINRTIWVQSETNTLQKVPFTIDPKVLWLSDKSKQDFNDEVNRNRRATKLCELTKSCTDFLIEVNYNHKRLT
jgi:glycosyltransferase involved in cell wall biosynthesis